LFLKKYLAVIVAFILIAVSLVILSQSLRRPGSPGVVKKLVFEVTAPVERAINSGVGSVSGAWKQYLFLVGLEEENRELRNKIAALQGEVNTYREMSLEGSRLKKVLALEDSTIYPTVAARVVGNEGSSPFRTIMINKGSTDGVKEGLPVISPEGVVGRVIECSWNYSKILLVTDYNSNIDSLVQGSRAQGILQGGGHRLLRLKYVQRTEEVKAGEAVITSGLGGAFPKGLMLGTVVRADKKDPGLFQTIEVVTSVDFSKIEEVLVLQTEKE
jgi:rod shape-determining protein MreC